MTVHRSPDRLLDTRFGSTMIELGGYVHPLFTDPEFLRRSPFAARPLPGQALLLLMGGLAEQSGAYDERTVALLGFESVVFRAAACDGDTVFVEVVPLPPTETGRVSRWNWKCLRSDGTVLVEATARFLTRTP